MVLIDIIEESLLFEPKTMVFLVEQKLWKVKKNFILCFTEFFL